ncbi:MAG: membrane integrity-associated transporter subunit PqiC [Nitrospirae bacterium]|nr:membrane integrity-associated transporter subunit PqiC [Nitrospirota bacterium]
MARVFFRGPGVLLIFFLLTLCGCAASTPSRFYQLSSVKIESRPAAEASRDKSVIVAVGPLRIPDYLNRPQIVTRSGENVIRLAEFDRWAGSLDHDITRVLVENISTLLPAESFFVTPWISAMQPPAAHWYRVEVSIMRFEGAPGGYVQMKAHWAIFDKDKGMLLKRESNISEEVHGAGYEAFVSALSKTLFSLSRDISNAVMSL